MEDDASAQMDAECTARVELVAVYRTLDRMGMNEGICNHLTALVPGTTDQFLCIRFAAPACLTYRRADEDVLLASDALPASPTTATVKTGPRSRRRA
jgi:ribulose-5-phosphate 4-epimerase/fuculose-1-phosphate aldolase